MTLVNLFKRNTQIPTRPLRTIEREMEKANARYMDYLKTTSDNFEAKRSNVTIKDPHTMVNDSYWELRNNIDTINLSAKNANKEITFEDARVLTRDDEFDNPSLENSLSKKILITVKDKLSPKNTKNQALVDVFEQPEKPLMEKVAEKLNELFSEKN